jgi:hypothetical protein
MSGSITMSVLRDENGKTFGTWTAREVTGTFAAPRLVAECTLCGNRQQFDVNAWYSVTKGRTIQCANFSGHRTVPKAETKPQPLTLDAINKMPADEYRRRLEHEVGFRERAEAILETVRKPMNHAQASEAKIAADKEAKIAPHRVMFLNAYHAFEHHNLRQPFHRLEGWLALPEAERQNIIKRFDLTDVDYTPNLDRMLGRS